ncbi:hypothetical protein OSTOST_15087 [Ostertagia ostertagi]
MQYSTSANLQEQVIELNRILRAAESAKEKIVQLSYKYFFTRKWYERLFDPIRCKKLGTSAEEINQHLRDPFEERRRNQTPWSSDKRNREGTQKSRTTSLQFEAIRPSRNAQKDGIQLHRTVQRQQDEIYNLKKKIEELEAMRTQHEEQLNRLQQVPKDEVREQAEAEISDKAYFEENDRRSQRRR